MNRVFADGHFKAVDATLLGPPPEVTDSLKIAWLAEDGSRVDEGQVVIRFDPTDMEEDLRRGNHDRETAQSKIVQKEAQERASSSNLQRDAEMASPRAGLRSAVPEQGPADLLARRDHRVGDRPGPGDAEAGSRGRGG